MLRVGCDRRDLCKRQFCKWPHVECSPEAANCACKRVSQCRQLPNNAWKMRAEPMAARPARLPSPAAVLHSWRALGVATGMGVAPRKHAWSPASVRHHSDAAGQRRMAAGSGGDGASRSVLFISPVRSGCVRAARLLFMLGGLQPAAAGTGHVQLCSPRPLLPRPLRREAPCTQNWPASSTLLCNRRSGRRGRRLRPGCAQVTLWPRFRSAAGRRRLPAPRPPMTTPQRSRQQGQSRASCRPTGQQSWRGSWLRRSRRQSCLTAFMRRRPSGGRGAARWGLHMDD